MSSYVYIADIVFRQTSEDIFTQTIRQDSHRLKRCLNIQDCLEKSLKIKFALKST